jgi:O-antigen/teichoic acid export membrane protein
VPDVLTTVFLAAMSGNMSDQEKTIALGRRMIRCLLATGVIGCVVLSLAPTAIIRAVFGQSYEATGRLLPLFGVVLALRFWASGYGILLTIVDRQNVRTLIVLGALVVSLTGNFVLVPRLGLQGAVVASIITHLFLLCVYALAAAQRFRTAFLDVRTYMLIALGGLATIVALAEPGTRAAVGAALLLLAAGIGLEPRELRRLGSLLSAEPWALSPWKAP